MRLSGIGLDIDTSKDYPILKDIKITADAQASAYINIRRINNGKVELDLSILDMLLDEIIDINLEDVDLTVQGYSALVGMTTYLEFNRNITGSKERILNSLEQTIKSRINSITVENITLEDLLNSYQLSVDYLECKSVIYMEKCNSTVFFTDMDLGYELIDAGEAMEYKTLWTDAGYVIVDSNDKPYLASKVNSKLTNKHKEEMLKVLNYLNKSIGNNWDIYKGCDYNKETGNLSLIFSENFIENINLLTNSAKELCERLDTILHET
jgi:hypothetical protein